MRSILSIPEQIKQNVINGDLKNVLLHVRLAYSNNVSDLIAGNTTIFAIANVLSLISISGKICDNNIKILSELIFNKHSNLASSLVIISYYLENPELTPIIPPKEVLEVLSVLATDQENLTNSELIKASYAFMK